MLQPFCHKDFAIRSLGDRIKDLNQCVHLYPDIPKDKAFGNYYTPVVGKLNYKTISNKKKCCELKILYYILSRINYQRIRETDLKNNCTRRTIK